MDITTYLIFILINEERNSEIPEILMETNLSIQNVSSMRKPSCGAGNSLYLLQRNEKLYLSFTIAAQGVLTVITSTLVLVAIKHLTQQKSRFFFVARLLSVHDIAAALLGRSVFLVFLNYDIKSCKVVLLLSSVLVLLNNLNSGIVIFISFDRLQQVRHLDRYQLQSNKKSTNIVFIIIVSWAVLWFVQENVNSLTPFPLVITTIFVAMYIVLVAFGVTCNLAASIILRRCKKRVRPTTLYINQRALRLTQLYIIFFVVFNIPIIVAAVIWITTDTENLEKALVFTVINIISNMDGIVNSVIFFLLKRPARNYLSRLSRTLFVGVFLGLCSKLGKRSKRESNTPTKFAERTATECESAL